MKKTFTMFTITFKDGSFANISDSSLAITQLLLNPGSTLKEYTPAIATRYISIELGSRSISQFVDNAGCNLKLSYTDGVLTNAEVLK